MSEIVYFYFLRIRIWSVLEAGLWIRIRIGSRLIDFLDPDPQPWGGNSTLKNEMFPPLTLDVTIKHTVGL
jgi:hypothetical protein